MTRFKKIDSEVTNCCNLACSFCHQTGRPKRFMQPAVFTEILDKIRPHTGFIALHVLGEPLVHPEFAEVLASCHGQGLQVNLTTNGTLLARHRDTLLTAKGLRQVNVSLHSLAQVEQGAAEVFLQEIIDFAKESSRAASFYVSLRLWNLQVQAGGNEEIGVWNDRLLAQLTTAFGVGAIRAEALAAARGIPLAPGVFINPEPQFSWPHPAAPELGRQGYCRGLRDHLAILADGTVVPCCLDADGLLGLGNILQQPLAEILAGPRARRMSEGFAHQWLVESLCRRCTYRLRFSSHTQL